MRDFCLKVWVSVSLEESLALVVPGQCLVKGTILWSWVVAVPSGRAYCAVSSTETQPLTVVSETKVPVHCFWPLH